MQGTGQQNRHTQQGDHHADKPQHQTGDIDVYVSGLVLGLISMVIALLGVAVLLTCSLQNGIILLVMAFLISPYGLPMAAIWLLGKVQDLKFAIQDLVYG